MSNLIIAADGNFTTLATWQVADTTMVKLDGVTSTGVTTGNLDSTTYTPGAITVDGIMLNMSKRPTTTGTLTVTLRNSTAGSDVTSVTVNVADLPVETTEATVPAICGSWHFFKFSAPQLLLGATNYVVRLTASTTLQVYFYAGASNNWNCLLRTTSNPGSLAAADRFFCSQAYTGAGAATTYTLTMDGNGTTSYGGMEVCNGVTETWVTGSATQVRHAGNVRRWGGSTLNRGTSGSPITAASILEFDCASDAQYGAEFYWNSTINIYGNPKANTITKLAADAAIGATSLTTVDAVDAWLNTDNVALASTTRTASETEMKALTAGGSGTTLTITALTNAHSGISPTQGELCNLTRNVVVQSVGASSTYVHISANYSGTFNKQYVEHINCGSATTGKRGVEIQNINGTVNISYCVTRSCSVASGAGFIITVPAATTNNITLTSNIAYAITGTNAIGIQQANATTGANTITGCVALGCTNGFSVLDVGGTFTNNTAAGNTTLGITIAESLGTIGTCSGNTAHSNGTVGFTAGAGASAFFGTVSTYTGWRNNTYNFNQVLGSTGTAANAKTVFDQFTLFGATTANAEITSSVSLAIEWTNWTVNAGVTLTCPIGFTVILNQVIAQGCLTLRNCSFGATTAHSSGDFSTAVASFFAQILCENTTFASTTEVTGFTAAHYLSYIQSDKHDGTAGNWRQFKKYGTLDQDTVNVEAPSTASVRMTPNNASSKLESDPFRVPVNNGQTCTPSVRVRKGTSYNGNEIILVVKRNDAMGITSDTTLDTGAAAIGTWETLSAATAAVGQTGTLDFVLSCDGTAGTCNYGNITAVVA